MEREILRRDEQKLKCWEIGLRCPVSWHVQMPRDAFI
jgi:hypothetical protein